MKLRALTLGVTLAALTAIAIPTTIVLARSTNSQDMHKAMFEHVAKELKLDDTQKASVQKILEAHQPSLEAGHKVLVEAMHNLLDAVANPDADEATVKDLHGRIATTTQDMTVEIHKMVQEINPILTADQRIKAKAYFDHMKSMHGTGHMGSHGMMGHFCKP